MSLPIALVYGGYSSERPVALQSAQNIAALLRTIKTYQTFLIDIQRKDWHCHYEDTLIPVDKNDFSIQCQGRKITFALAVILIHGTPGEDGKLQGYFDMIGQKYLSCAQAVSTLTAHKKYCLSYLKEYGIPCAPSLLFQKNDKDIEKTIQAGLSFPLFIKPNSGGSSIGMSKVCTPSGLSAALAKAFEEEDTVLVETFLEGRELTVGLFRTSSGIQVLPPTEIKTDRSFFDYEAKYSGASEEITPAPLSPELLEHLQNTARRIYEYIHASGIIRIDFIYRECEKKLYFLEVNTIPGQTAQSLVPQQIQAAGLDPVSLYQTLIQEALSGNPSFKSGGNPRFLKENPDSIVRQ